MPGPANPAGAPPMKPGYDAMPSTSSGVSPASAMARSAASAVRSMSVRKSRRPIADCPTPDRMARRSSRSSGATRRGGRDSTSAVSVRFGGVSGVVRSAAASARGVSSGSKIGSEISSVTFRNVTFTGMPMRTASGGQPTTLVVRRRLRCSTSSTMAIT